MSSWRDYVFAAEAKKAGSASEDTRLTPRPPSLPLSPGSATVQQLFFDELGAVFEQLATYQAPVYIAGDFNIRLDRPDDPHSAQFHLLADCYGLTLHHTDATHQLGGTLDAVITRKDAGRPDNILVVDVGLSDHHLLQWSVDTTRRETPADCCRSWRQTPISSGPCCRILHSANQTPGQPTSMTWPLCTTTSSTVYLIG